MRTYKPGDAVKFKSDHGSILEGTVYDSTSDAVMITTLFGTYSVNRDKIISGGSVLGSSIESKVDYGYDIGWWESLDEDQDTF